MYAPTSEISFVTRILSINCGLSAITAKALNSQQFPSTPKYIFLKDFLNHSKYFDDELVFNGKWCAKFMLYYKYCLIN